MSFSDFLTNPQDWVAYFGYGSLVNDRTRNAQSFGIAGRLKGYRRHWSIWKASSERQAFGFGGIAALSVAPDPTAWIDGLLIFDRRDHLPNVDEREAHYDRLSLNLADFTAEDELPEGIESFIYVGQPAHTDAIDPAFPILQSYVDAVMQGFLHKFGPDGLIRFVEETSGWQMPIVMDRHRPFYPRNITLSGEEEKLVDAAIKAAEASLVPLDGSCHPV